MAARRARPGGGPARYAEGRVSGPAPRDENGAPSAPIASTLAIEADEIAPPAGAGGAVPPRGGTFESFRYRDYRLFWGGALLSNIGSWMQVYALGIVVFGLRGSSFDLGLVNFLSGVPVLVLALPAGAIADRLDRRWLLIVLQAVLLLQAGALGVLYNGGLLGAGAPATSLMRVAALGLLGGVCMSLVAPAYQSMVPDLVPRPLLMNAIAINAVQFHVSRLLGPLAAAGLVLFGAGMGEVFYVNAASFLFVIAALWAIRLRGHGAAAGVAGRGHGAPAGEERSWRQASWHALTAGLRHARADRATGVLLLSTAIMTICAFPYMTLLPAIVHDSLGASGRALSRAVAFVMAANGLGALAGALTVASLPRTVRRDHAIPALMLALGALLVAFSLSRWLPLTLALSALAGACLLAINSLANTAIQSGAPPAVRGRVMALYVLAFMGMMPISGLLFGSIGQALGPARAVQVGAAALLAWALALLLRPALLRERARAETTARG
jgi:MFS family permease